MPAGTLDHELVAWLEPAGAELRLFLIRWLFVALVLPAVEELDSLFSDLLEGLSKLIDLYEERNPE